VHVGISTSVIQRGQTGIAQYVFALARALLDQGKHDYTFFVLEDDLDLFKFAAGKARLTVVAERFRPALKNIAWHQTVLPGLAKRLRLDVLHVPSYRRMLWPRPCPLVATIHDLAQFHLRAKYNWPRMLYGRIIVPRLARRQDQIVAISENTARDVSRFFRVPRAQLTVIHNGVDHSRFCPGDIAPAKALSARRFGLELPFFLYVARLEHPAKNHARLIAAFNRFKAANWLWLAQIGTARFTFTKRSKSRLSQKTFDALALSRTPSCPICTVRPMFLFIPPCSRDLGCRPLRPWLAVARSFPPRAVPWRKLLGTRRPVLTPRILMR
jgi:glycosyltransferase involved in cell wall biosynthesis